MRTQNQEFTINMVRILYGPCICSELFRIDNSKNLPVSQTTRGPFNLLPLILTLTYVSSSSPETEFGCKIGTVH